MLMVCIILLIRVEEVMSCLCELCCESGKIGYVKYVKYGFLGQEVKS